MRSKAVEWLSHLGDDDICDFLPQLVQVPRERERVREKGGGRREEVKACVSSVIPSITVHSL